MAKAASERTLDDYACAQCCSDGPLGLGGFGVRAGRVPRYEECVFDDEQARTFWVDDAEEHRSEWLSEPSRHTLLAVSASSAGVRERFVTDGGIPTFTFLSSEMGGLLQLLVVLYCGVLIRMRQTQQGTGSLLKALTSPVALAHYVVIPLIFWLTGGALVFGAYDPRGTIDDSLGCTGLWDTLDTSSYGRFIDRRRAPEVPCPGASTSTSSDY